ncbi:MAG: ABC transporter substrate-binding protein [Alphaproteobacteria bacterium 64-6]|nr:ABC transporter substrate-binding protein [Hyphomicrobium sp.]OJU25976.1 MAG: ABC transporter substrate-binding protein [Alphaproteobacteria bacterium 64-6]
MRLGRLAVAFAMMAVAAVPALAQAPIKVGEINSYKVIPAFLEPYRKGWELAVEQINKSGGINGRPLEVISRDDNGAPGDAVRAAEELVSREGVVLLTGGFLSHVGLAVADFAKQRKMPFIASEPLTDKIVWENGNKYTFRLRASTYMQTSMLVEEAVKLNKRRWALVYPNYEYGQSAVASFKQLMSARQPGVEFVVEQAPPLNRIDAGSVAQAVADAKPDAIFNVTFGADLQKFVREGTTRGLFNDRVVLSVLGGEPEYLDPLRDEAPVGWIVTGYPWYAIDTPEHKAFLEAYRAKFNDYPRLGSVVGYSAMISVGEALRKAKSTDPEAIVAAAKGLEHMSPFGPIKYREIDHQSTMGAYVGRIGIRDGKGVMVDWRYEPGERHLPSDDVVKKLRPE